MIDSLGDVGGALGSAQPDRVSQLYADLRIQLRYDSRNGRDGQGVAPRHRERRSSEASGRECCGG